MRFLKSISYIILILSASCSDQSASVSPIEKTRHQKWIEDIAYFENEFLDKAKTYTKESKASCKSLLNTLKTEIDELSDFQIRLKLSKCVVMADNAHTESPLPLMDKIPLRFFRFSDAMYVVKTDSASSKYLGHKVLKINGIHIDSVERKLFPYISGIESWKKFKTMSLITAPKILNELDLGKKDSISLTLVKDKDTLTVSLASKKVQNDRYWFKAWANLMPPPVGSDSHWKFIQKNDKELPLYLKDVERGVFYSFMDTQKLAYFQINSFWDQCTDFKGKIKDFNTELKTRKNHDVVIDLRFYTGGDYGLAIHLATKPPKIINSDRKIYLIVSDKTYSAGIVTAARIKHFAKDKIYIVGEEVGDRLKFWAEGELCQLPNSKIRIYNAKKEHDWVDNKRSIFRTHLPNYIHGVAVKHLNLDKEIQFSYSDYVENRDPVLEWIISQR